MRWFPRAPEGSLAARALDPRLGALAVIALVFLSRAAFLPPTLEDLDSTNFALALERFDPSQHQPHPPGYPLYVAAARAVAAVTSDSVTALSLVSALSQAALVFPLVLLFRSACGDRRSAGIATLIVLTNPVLWFNGARPMSDSLGLLVILVAQVLLLRALEGQSGLLAGSFLLGLAPGVRLQSLLLTVPLWLAAVGRARGRRAGALLAAAVGTACWIVPVALASGGFRAYWAAFSSTMGQALAIEPLLSAFTLNRAARSLWHVAIGPWVETPFGLVVLGLGTLGFARALLNRTRSLALMVLAFGPYLVVHTFFQDVETVRYSLPYLPLVAFLATEGIGVFADRLPEHVRPLAAAAPAAALALCGASFALPALSAYATSPSPAVLAREAVSRLAAPPSRFVLTSHYIFQRFLSNPPRGLEYLTAPPGQAVRRLAQYWRSGGRVSVLMVTERRRTDLAELAPDSWRLLGTWSRPQTLDRFLTGVRPNAAKLLRIEPPRWFAAWGFNLSLESGDLARLERMPERRAFLRREPNPTFLLIAGEPFAPAATLSLQLLIDGTPIDEFSCGEARERGDLLPAAAGRSAGYRELLARTRRRGAPAGAPYVLRGLDYGTVDRTGFVHGKGWFYPEKDRWDRPFRWISSRARSLLHVPPGTAATLAISGIVPVEYVGSGGRVAVKLDGVSIWATTISRRGFQLEARLPPSNARFRELVIESERAFVPDRIQYNGDRRRLALRVYGFRVAP